MNDFVMPEQPGLVNGAPDSAAAILLRSARTDNAAKHSKDRVRAMLGLVEAACEANDSPLGVTSLPNRARIERAKRSRPREKTIEKFVPFQHLLATPKPISARKLGGVAIAAVQVATILAALFVRPVPRIEPASEVAALRRDEPEMSLFAPKKSIAAETATATTPDGFTEGIGAKGAEGDPKPQMFKQGMMKPERIAGTDPVYPLTARLRRVTGTVTIKCVVTEKGLAENCKTSPSPAYLEEAVLSAAPTWRFTPVTFQGQAVPVNYVFKISFKLG